jgi:hypothetical protein
MKFFAILAASLATLALLTTPTTEARPIFRILPQPVSHPLLIQEEEGEKATYDAFEAELDEMLYELEETEQLVVKPALYRGTGPKTINVGTSKSSITTSKTPQTIMV